MRRSISAVLRRWAPGVLVAAALAACGPAVPERDPASVFEDVEGFEVVSLSPRFEQELRFEFGSKPHVAESVTDTAVRAIQSRDGRPLGAVVVLALDPSAVAGQGRGEAVVRGFFAQPPQRRMVAGRTVFQGGFLGAEQSHGVAWLEDNLVVLLIADDPAQASAMAEALMGA